MQLPPLLNAAMLWVHLFSAVLFVGGSAVNAVCRRIKRYAFAYGAGSRQ